VPWLGPLFKLLPVPKDKKQDTLAFYSFAKDRFNKRKAKGTDRADVFSYLLDRDDESGKVLRPKEVEAESRIVIIAGANSTGLSLAFCGFHLFTNPKTYKKLRQEVDSIWDGVSPIDGLTLGPDRAPYLNACIWESLRLKPPGPNGMQRRTPANGHMVAGKWIPPETQLSVHAWTMQRDERFYTRANEFIPERWLDNERPADWIHDTRAYIPFSVGQLSCVGKQLALLEMRLFWTTLLKKFDWELSPTFDPVQFEKDCKSNLTLTKGRLPVKVIARKLPQVAT